MAKNNGLALILGLGIFYYFFTRAKPRDALNGLGNGTTIYNIYVEDTTEKAEEKADVVYDKVIEHRHRIPRKPEPWMLKPIAPKGPFPRLGGLLGREPFLE